MASTRHRMDLRHELMNGTIGRFILESLGITLLTGRSVIIFLIFLMTVLHC